MHIAANDALSVLSKFGVTSIPISQRCRDGDTHGIATVRRLYSDHGADHLGDVLKFATLSISGQSNLTSDVLAAISDVLLIRSPWPQEAIQEAFAAIDLFAIRKLAVSLRPWPVRQTMRALIDAHLDRLFCPVETINGGDANV